jgi:hypothetical protein
MRIMGRPGATVLALPICLAACGHSQSDPVVSSGPAPQPTPMESVLQCAEPLSIQIFKNDQSFGHEWSVAAGLLTYNRMTSDGYENIFVSLPDGTGEQALTLGNPVVAGKHACSPVWTPPGDLLFFSAEKAQHPGSSTDAFCGFGAYADIWVMTADGREAFQLTDVPNDINHGAMIPRLSRDGTRLLWTERIAAPNLLVPAQAFGSWVLKVADIQYKGAVVSLANVTQFQPGDQGFYEGGDFTPDGSGIIYTSSSATDNAWESQIFVMDLGTHAVTQLTMSDYNEHPRYTPDGTQIIWMSSTGAVLKGTDWWFMNADGTEKQRLTYFEDPHSPQSSGTALYPGTVAWDPGAKWFIGDMETSLVTQTYSSVVVSCAAIPDGGASP